MTAPYRPVFCLLGLPFDALTLDVALARLQAPGVAAGQAGGAEILSTPNLNWVVLARAHPAFRESVLASALSVVDGQPLVWIARLLGVPLPERVSGADLFQGLQQAGANLRVFFLGGMGHVARRASAALNRDREAGVSGLVGVGGLDPGSGSIASMSRPEILHAVNEGQPDLVVVSLGALRGQAWVMQNRKALGAQWVTHLGAVVNFVAGEVRRAPRWMQRSGMEWLWRVLQEPKLWQRYVGDGLALLRLLATRTLPLLFWRARYRQQEQPPVLTPLADGSGLALAGAWAGEAAARQFHAAVQGLLAASPAPAPAVLPALMPAPAPPLQLHLADVTYLGADVIGQWLVLRGALSLERRTLVLAAPSLAVRRLLHGEAAEFLLS